VYHFWQIDRGDTHPLGPPQLMMSVTGEETLDKPLMEERNRRMGINQEHKRQIREHIQSIQIDPLADRAAEIAQQK